MIHINGKGGVCRLIANREIEQDAPKAKWKQRSWVLTIRMPWPRISDYSQVQSVQVKRGRPASSSPLRVYMAAKSHRSLIW